AHPDDRNVLNLRNALQVFLETNDIVSAKERENRTLTHINAFRLDANANVLLDADNNIDPTCGGAGNAGCANYTTTGGASAVPSCIYLIRAEQRYGDGDGILPADEQETLATESYFSTRGVNNFLSDSRRMRL